MEAPAAKRVAVESTNGEPRVLIEPVAEQEPPHQQEPRSPAPQVRPGEGPAPPSQSRKPRVEHAYRIGGVLGKGAFSVVREARHRTTGDLVALKLIAKTRFHENERAKEAVSKEIEAMGRIRRIDNPSLVRMLDLYEDDAKIALVLEHLAGGELFDRIVSRGQYSERDASQLIFKLCSALHACHEHGVLHRDMKPENCIYATADPDAEIKITDFGLALLSGWGGTGQAAAAAQAEQAGAAAIGGAAAVAGPAAAGGIAAASAAGDRVAAAVAAADGAAADGGEAPPPRCGPPRVVEHHLVGTPGYVAPEVLERHEYGPGCDVWSTGVILYILLVGYPPFYAENNNQARLFETIKKGQYYFHPEAWDPISAEAKDLVQKMLTVDVTRRISMAGVLEHPWVRKRSVLPAAHLGGTIQRLKTFNAKRKWRAAAMVCMVGARFALKRRLRAVVGEGRGLTTAELVRLKEAFALEHRAADTAAKAAAAVGEVAVDGFGGGGGSSSSDGDGRGFGASADAAASWPGGGCGCDEGREDDKEAACRGVTRERFAALLNEIGFGNLPADRMFELFDKDGDGAVDHKEFLAGMSTLRSDGDESLRFCFDVYDADGSGSITLQELKDVLFATAGEAREELEKAGKLAKMFERLDVNSDGEISYEEFKAGIQDEPLLVNAFLQPLFGSSALLSLQQKASSGAGAVADAAGAGVPGAGAGAGATAGAAGRTRAGVGGASAGAASSSAAAAAFGDKGAAQASLSSSATDDSMAGSAASGSSAEMPMAGAAGYASAAAGVAGGAPAAGSMIPLSLPLAGLPVAELPMPNTLPPSIVTPGGSGWPSFGGGGSGNGGWAASGGMVPSSPPPPVAAAAGAAQMAAIGGNSGGQMTAAALAGFAALTAMMEGPGTANGGQQAAAGLAPASSPQPPPPAGGNNGYGNGRGAGAYAPWPPANAS